MRIHVAIATITLSLCATGCGGKEPSPPPVTPPAMEEALPKAEPATVAPPEVPSAGAEGAADGEGGQTPEPRSPLQLVMNGDMEVWKNQRPIGWICKPGEVTANTTEIEGRTVAQLNPGGGDYVVLEQIVDRVKPGQLITISGRIKAAAPNDAVLKVLYLDGEEEKSRRWDFTATNEWQDAGMEFHLPEKLRNGRVLLQVLRAPNAQAPVLADDLSLLGHRE